MIIRILGAEREGTVLHYHSDGITIEALVARDRRRGRSRLKMLLDANHLHALVLFLVELPAYFRSISKDSDFTPIGRLRLLGVLSWLTVIKYNLHVVFALPGAW